MLLPFVIDPPQLVLVKPLIAVVAGERTILLIAIETSFVLTKPSLHIASIGPPRRPGCPEQP